MRRTKIFLIGSDGTGWSIDEDRRTTQELISALPEYEITKNIITAKVIYFVWWQQLLQYRHILRRLNKEIIVCATNELTLYKKQVELLKPTVHKWICANNSQINFLKDYEVNTYYHPFYVDSEIFRPFGQARESIMDRLQLDKTKLRGKIIITSLQKDTLLENLDAPKWQKGPELFLEIVAILDTRFHVLIGGPRRHWLIKQMKSRGIDYTFVGDESALERGDDVFVNNLDKETISLLYNLTDIYIVSSKSEGGPKAIIEALLTKTYIISTDVGMAADFLPEEQIYRSAQQALSLIMEYTGNKRIINERINRAYDKALSISNKESSVLRMKAILDAK